MTMGNILQIIQELLTLLQGFNIGGANAARDAAMLTLYNAAVLGSDTAAQTLYANQLKGNPMNQPHETVVASGKYWAMLVAAGWTVVDNAVVAPAHPVTGGTGGTSTTPTPTATAQAAGTFVPKA
jgi:hypothetical protein